MIYISTNLFKRPEQFPDILDLVASLPEPVGIEIFPLWQFPQFEEQLYRHQKYLSSIPTSFHGPYYDCEPSATPNSPAYLKMMTDYDQTFKFAVLLGSKYIVHHHNNQNVYNKAEMTALAQSNLSLLVKQSVSYRVPLLIENAGVGSNCLFSQSEFIEMAKQTSCSILIDVGHVHANGWDIEIVMSDLKQKIIAYHLHNNDGSHDSHQRILEGSFDIPRFFDLYQRYTPTADLVLEYSAAYANQLDLVREDVQYCIERSR